MLAKTLIPFFVSVSMVLMAPTAAYAARVAINIESTPPGAAVFLDSTEQAIGYTPLKRVRVDKGAHTLIFQLDGYADARLPIDARRWNETFKVVLNQLGTIDIRTQNADANDAELRLDGELIGMLPFRADILPGRHLLEVRKAGFTDFSQWIQVGGGQVLTLPVQLTADRPKTGSVLVAADVTGAPVYIDGQPRGATPTVIDGLSEGTHQVEIKPAGLPPHSAVVTITAGERAALNPQLRPVQAATGTLRVITNAPKAVVRLNGETLGEAPVARDNVPEGEHILEAEAVGFERSQQVVTVKAGERKVVAVELKASAAPPPPVVVEAPPTPTDLPLKVSANVGGATLFVDGKEAGPVPFEGSFPAGEHRIEVRKEGFQAYSAQLQLSPADSPRSLEVKLLTTSDGPSKDELEALAEERVRQEFGSVSHAAGPLPIDQVVVDLSLGFPHFLETRFSVGMLDFLEGGFAARTFGRLTEFEVRGEVGIRPIRHIGLAAQARLGGGLGPRGANTFFMTLEGKSSLYFGEHGAFTLHLATDFTTDGYGYAAKDADMKLMGSNRQTMVRLRLGGNLEFVVTRHWNIWGQLEGILADPADNSRPNTTRRIYGDILGTGGTDTELYMRAGVTYKF